MTELRDRANDIYHNCETHGEIVDKIERMLILEAQNADLLAACEWMIKYGLHLCYRGDLDNALSALRRALEWLPHQDGCAIRRGYACTCCHSGLYDTLRELGKP